MGVYGQAGRWKSRDKEHGAAAVSEDEWRRYLGSKILGQGTTMTADDYRYGAAR